jgi:hypothetical protein
MPRRLLALLVVSLAVLATVAARPLLFPPTNPRITRENFQWIMERMRREDVESILGPPGDYRTGPTSSPKIVFSGSGFWEGSAEPFYWQGDEYEILLDFNTDGRVCEMYSTDMELDPVGLLALLRWRWDRWRGSPAVRQPALNPPKGL